MLLLAMQDVAFLHDDESWGHAAPVNGWGQQHLEFGLAGPVSHGILLSPFHKRMRYITALSRVSEQNSCRSCPAASRIDTDFLLWDGLGINVVNGRLSTSPETVWLVRAW
jgi:hypothetical protein